MFGEYAVTYLNMVADFIRRLGAKVIIHICGDVRAVSSEIPRLSGDALSFDAMVDLAALKAKIPGIKTMGNLSTYLLEFGPADKVARPESMIGSPRTISKP